ncbi:unnamed protein product [Pleuronectes platessa]|uniref:Uncharacterized protein n=1 Tax=Pleuronectes platessa TaxID=8262 RepID=A0A9N7YG79_PLEPL|nr:unnamed protein product [Pleuronectes platessa]
MVAVIVMHSCGNTSVRPLGIKVLQAVHVTVVLLTNREQSPGELLPHCGPVQALRNEKIFPQAPTGRISGKQGRQQISRFAETGYKSTLTETNKPSVKRPLAAACRDQRSVPCFVGCFFLLEMLSGRRECDGEDENNAIHR